MAGPEVTCKALLHENGLNNKCSQSRAHWMRIFKICGPINFFSPIKTTNLPLTVNLQYPPPLIINTILFICMVEAIHGWLNMDSLSSMWSKVLVQLLGFNYFYFYKWWFIALKNRRGLFGFDYLILVFSLFLLVLINYCIIL